MKLNYAKLEQVVTLCQPAWLEMSKYTEQLLNGKTDQAAFAPGYFHEVLIHRDNRLYPGEVTMRFTIAEKEEPSAPTSTS